MRAAILLAAGHSSRMGAPKALTRLGEEPALLRVVRACEDARVHRIVVVLGLDATRVRAELPWLDGRVRVALNPDPDAGRTGSLQRGLALARPDEALVWPIDHPLASSATAGALLDAPGEWVVPERDGRGGHPIVLRGRAVAAVLAADAATPLRDALRAAGIEQARFPVEDDGVLANLDTPSDVRAWRKGI